MFNYNLLDDQDFESLCKDMMSKKLGKKLYNFPRGRDGGIDVSDGKLNPDIVIQVKHYYNSTVSNLINSLKKEKSKVEEFTPENYYLFTSLELPHTRRIEIVEMFKPFMTSLDNIVTRKEIDAFLNDSLNRDVLSKHKKLWIQSVNILSEFQSKAVTMDSYALLDEIDTKKKYYVNTQIYEKSLEKVSSNNMLILLGNPGVGKTVISEMIILEYLNLGYKLIYASTNNLQSVKEAIIESTEANQIIFLDDFLGQHYLKIDEQKTSELRTLISYVRTLKNTKLILNSRITIINEASLKDNKFKELHEKYSDYEIKITDDSISKYEKGEILSNHLLNNNVSEENYEYLMSDSRFLDIVNHTNFNPRIIEYATKNSNNKDLSGERYYKYILHNLENPKDVWENEFINRIQPIDRMFLYVLYSISEGRAYNDELKLAFEKRISNENTVDKTINNYEMTLKRLSNSLVKILDGYLGTEISIINPSMSEYIYKELLENVEEQRNILNNAYFYDQIVQSVNHESLENKRVEKLKNRDVLDYPTSLNAPDIYTVFLAEVVTYRIIDSRLSKKVKMSLDNIRSRLFVNNYFDFEMILDTLITGSQFEIYSVINILVESENLDNILSFIGDIDYLILLYDKCYNGVGILQENIQKVFRKHLNFLIKPLLMLLFRINTFGVNFEKELKFYTYINLEANEKEKLQNELTCHLYDKAKNILKNKVISIYMAAKIEIRIQELEQLVDDIFEKEDIKLAVIEHFKTT